MTAEMLPLPAIRNDTVIVRLEAARTALSEAKTIQQSKSIADVAAAAEIYARRQKLGEEAIDFAHAVKIEALRKLGELLAETPKAKARFDGTSREPSKNGADTLAQMGIDKKTSSMAQKLAALPEKDFEAVRDGHEAVGQAIKKVDGTRKVPSKKVADKGDGKARAELIALQGKYADLAEKNTDLADTARELSDKLEMYEAKEPDEQQKLIAQLQKQLQRKDQEIARLTTARNDCQHKVNELIRQLKMERKKRGG